MDFLEKAGAEISFKQGKLTLSATAEEPHTYATTFAKHAAFTVFPEGKVGRSPQLKQREEPSSDGRSSEDARSETFAQRHRIWHTRATGNVTEAPRRRRFATSRQEMERNFVSERKPYSRNKRDGALKIDAEVAKIKSRHNNESENLVTRRPRKQHAKKQRSYQAQDAKPRPPFQHRTRRDSVRSHTSSEKLSANKIRANPLEIDVSQEDKETANQVTRCRESLTPSPLTPPAAVKHDSSYRPADSTRSSNRRALTRSRAKSVRKDYDTVNSYTNS